MMSLSDDKQADIIDPFNTLCRYLDDILNINNINLTIWLAKYTLQIFNISNDIVSTKISDKRDDFEIFTFLSKSRSSNGFTLSVCHW